jgi:two-component system OmpR family response regulator
MRLLVVEDDSKIASFVVKGLKEAGYAVDHCSDGEEALIMGESTSYDALIVDLMLPHLDGLSVDPATSGEGKANARPHPQCQGERR